jgi:cell division protein FtsQ
MDPSGSTRRSVNGTALALLLLAVLLSGFLVFQSSLFSVGAVIVNGHQYLGEDEILRIAGIGARVNIFRLDTGDIQRRLTQDLRIASAEVTRQLPGTIMITVRERQPAAFIATAYGFAQMDGEGMILAVAKSIRQMNVPLITGHNIGGSYVGETVESPVVRSILHYLAALSEPAFRQLSEIHIEPSGQITGYTVNAALIKLGGIEQMTEKAAKTSEIISNGQNSLTQIEYIDVSYATPYVKFRKEREER